VALGNAEVLKAQIERYGKVEVMGEIAPKTEANIEPKSELKTHGSKTQLKTPIKPE
jgi:hypothetical protein